MYIGPRSSSLFSSHPPTFLQSFRYLGLILDLDDMRLAEIILLCPHLVDLQLGCHDNCSAKIPHIDRAIGTLSRLRTLHRYYIFDEPASADEIKENTAPYGSTALTELIDYRLPYPGECNGLLQAAIRRSRATLEVLFLRSNDHTQVLNLTYLYDLFYFHDASFARLTHLELIVDMTPETLRMLSFSLSKLALVHLGVGNTAYRLLPFANFKSLKSLCLKEISQETDDAWNLYQLQGNSQIESFKVYRVWRPLCLEFIEVLMCCPWRRLWLLEIPMVSMKSLLQRVNFSLLQMLWIFAKEFHESMEAILAARSADFTPNFMLHLIYRNSDNMREIQKANVRDARGSSTRLSSRLVRMVDYETAEKDYYSFILPPSHR
ncbi:hypothetical protein EC991_006466 [Linnemannia zychae]|nr:hypothetical protein EC991_006466 [Linnemannia zychae]